MDKKKSHMKKILYSALICVLFVSCDNNTDYVSTISFSNESTTSNRNEVAENSNRFGTENITTGEFTYIYNDTSTLDVVKYPYIDTYNVAFYDNSYLLSNCPSNGKVCVDLSHFIGKNILPLNIRRLPPIFYGETNSGFDNIIGSNTYRVFDEIGFQDLLVTHDWMTNDAANTVLNMFRAEVENNFQISKIKAFRIHTKEYFGPSRRVVVGIKTTP